MLKQALKKKFREQKAMLKHYHELHPRAAQMEQELADAAAYIMQLEHEISVLRAREGASSSSQSLANVSSHSV